MGGVAGYGAVRLVVRMMASGVGREAAGSRWVESSGGGAAGWGAGKTGVGRVAGGSRDQGRIGGVVRLRGPRKGRVWQSGAQEQGYRSCRIGLIKVIGYWQAMGHI